MKPKLSVIFDLVTDTRIKDIQIEKMSVSKHRRKVWLTFSEKHSPEISALIESELKRRRCLLFLIISFLFESCMLFLIIFLLV